MFAPDAYQLLDFGDGRRLERFGALVLDRPAPVAEGVRPEHPELWREADAQFARTGPAEGEWQCRRELPQRWTIAQGRLVFELKRTEFGHLGVFPEQAANWDWIGRQVCAAGRVLKVLNLFAYTGGSTLAAAAAGAEVVHVDAARNVVAWARRNAELSGLGEAAIHWIGEDARKFVRRELRRGSRYDAVILDPPSYGHGPRGEVWRLTRHLGDLLAGCAELTSAHRAFILLTCHTPDFDPLRLARMVREALGGPQPGRVVAEPMAVTTPAGRRLPSGVMVRWEGRSEGA